MVKELNEWYLLDKESQTKLLGVIENDTLTWKDHVNYTGFKLNTNININALIYKLSKYKRENSILLTFFLICTLTGCVSTIFRVILNKWTCTSRLLCMH